MTQSNLILKIRSKDDLCDGNDAKRTVDMLFATIEGYQDKARLSDIMEMITKALTHVPELYRGEECIVVDPEYGFIHLYYTRPFTDEENQELEESIDHKNKCTERAEYERLKLIYGNEK